MERPDVWTIGHAGAAGEAPANTLAAVRACLASGAEAMEIDVQLSRDGVPVLMHDTTVDRTTNLSGSVRDLSLATLQAADAGDGEPVPSLDQVLDLVDGRLAVYCELKATPDDVDHDRRLVEAVLRCIDDQDAQAWSGIHSFNPAIVAAARREEPRVSAALIAGPVRPNGQRDLTEQVLQCGAQALSVHYGSTSADLMRAARRAQLTVWTWTVDEEVDWQAAVTAGVDGIITNVPASLKAFLSRLE